MRTVLALTVLCMVTGCTTVEDYAQCVKHVSGPSWWAHAGEVQRQCLKAPALIETCVVETYGGRAVYEKIRQAKPATLQEIRELDELHQQIHKTCRTAVYARLDTEPIRR